MSKEQILDFKVNNLGKTKEKEKNTKQEIKEDKSTSFVNSSKPKGQSFSIEFQDQNQIDNNILNQQIFLGKSSDSNNEDEEEKNNMDFLPLLNKPNKNGKNGKYRKLENGSQKMTLKKKSFYEEMEQNKANQDTFNFMKMLKQSKKKKEISFGANHKNQQNLTKIGVGLPQNIGLDEIEIEEEIKENKNDPLAKFGQHKSAIADIILNRANMGRRGLGYTQKMGFEKDEIDSIHNYDDYIKFEQNTRKKQGNDYNPQMKYEANELKNKKKEYQNQIQMLMGKRESMEMSIDFCNKHSFKKIEFICSSEDCLKELCSMCILEHKEHIDMIKHVHTHIKEQYDIVKNMDLKKIKKKINDNEEKNSRQLDNIYMEIKDILYKRIHGLKDSLVKSNNRVRSALSNMKRFKEQFSILDQNPRMVEFHTLFSKTSSELIKSCISFPTVKATNRVQIEKNILKQKLEEILRDNMAMNCSNTDFNSVNSDIPKFLHWFEWGGRNLYLYDIVNNKSRSIRLVNNIKIPTFSRSIMIPEGKIFLLGGEDPEGQPKREIYQFDLANLDSDHILEAKALMPHQKYDFTLCYLNGYIYVICGKDTSSEAVDICERYIILKE